MLIQVLERHRYINQSNFRALNFKLMKSLKHYTALSLTLFLSFSFVLSTLKAQTDSQIFVISGNIVDSKKEPIPGVSVNIKGTVSGSVTDIDGKFEFKTKIKFPLILQINSVGFKSKEVEVQSGQKTIDLELETENVLVNEVVVSASKIEESILKSPVAIEKLDIRAIKQAASGSFYDALENVKGVQMLTSSLTFKVPNTRGFNVPNNFRFMQLVDGVDMIASTLGVPLGNAIGPTELDIQSVEITQGSASALYGMNAINGLANLQTKNPFIHQGLSIYQKVGINHIDGIDRSPSALTETAVRYAKAFNNKFAFKLNFSSFQGTDWVANGLTDQNPQNLGTANPNFPELSGDNNPAKDQWSRYGDDRQARQAIVVNNKGKAQSFNVARTGYLEKDLTNPTVKNLKFDGGLFYKINEKVELSYSYRYGLVDGIFQRGNRIQLNDVTVQNHKLELHTNDLTIRGYYISENTGKSYNLNPLAYNLDLNNGTNAVWGAKFKKELQAQLDNSSDLVTAMNQARVVADKGRAEPGTPQFDALKNIIINSNNWDIASAFSTGAPYGGAALLQYSNTYHTDFQYKVSALKWANVLVGADYRRYELIPDGNTFVDFSRPVETRTVADANGSFGENQIYTKYGGFVQVSKAVFNDKIKVTVSGRVDNNPEFSPKFDPRIALVYSPTDKQSLRVSLQDGYRYPSLFEALSFLNNAGVRRVGGLARVNQSLGFLDNSYTLASVDIFTAAVTADVAKGLTSNAAALKNRDFLQIANLPTMSPEKIKSFEAGYKSILLNNTLSVDFDAYYNTYTGFLGQVDVAVPTSEHVGTDGSVTDMLTRSKQNRFRVFTNAKNIYNSYGASLGLNYNIYKSYTISGNVNYNKLSQVDAADIFLTSFNTPDWITNLSVGNREVVKNIGFNVAWHWQNSVYWESTLANGQVPAYSSLDAQVNFSFPKIKSNIKIGGTNVLNNRHIQFAAGPTIGALYFVAWTIDGLLK